MNASDDKPGLPSDLQAQLDALTDDPDTVDVPEAPETSWLQASYPNMVDGRPISIRLDTDVADWLRRKHQLFQTEVNRILREKMDAETR